MDVFKKELYDTDQLLKEAEIRDTIYENLEKLRKEAIDLNNLEKVPDEHQALAEEILDGKKRRRIDKTKNAKHREMWEIMERRKVDKLKAKKIK